MINWAIFPFFAVFSVICWIFASFLSVFAIKSRKNVKNGDNSVGNDNKNAENSLKSKKNREKIAFLTYFLGILALFVFIIGLWVNGGRPPLQTKGETRLWFSFFLSIIGGFIYLFWRYRAMLAFTSVLASVFLLLNVFQPALQTQELMPILRSFWFIPHVTIYICSYAFLGAAFLFALAYLFSKKASFLHHCDRLVKIGVGCFTLGFLFGMVWAKAAWGNFWSWDAKECWALATWFIYIFYLRYRAGEKSRKMVAALLLIFAFFCLQICWWGVNYLPKLGSGLHDY